MDFPVDLEVVLPVDFQGSSWAGRECPALQYPGRSLVDLHVALLVDFPVDLVVVLLVIFKGFLGRTTAQSSRTSRCTLAHLQSIIKFSSHKVPSCVY